jgi:hypothetical protein
MKKIKVNKKIINKYRFHIAIGFYMTVFVVLSRIPYVNLFVAQLSGALLWAAVIIWLGFKAVHLIRVGLVLLFIVCLLTIFGETAIAENIGNAIFLILLTGVVKFIRDTLDDQ